jgi:eukaryotic-like serine/threonine-protein kinase
LKAVPFDAARLAVTGPAFAVADISTRSSFHARNFAIADDGTLVVVPALIHRDAGTLVWVDRSGGQEVITTVDRPIDSPALSHDGTRVAFRTPAPFCDIWVYSLARGTTTRVTSEGDNHGMEWSADDERLATFRREAVDGRAVWFRSDAGGDTGFMHAEPLDYVGLTDVSPDERYAILAMQDPITQFDLSLVDARTGTVTPLLASRFNEAFATFSPDGRHLAYVTNESGTNETYVQTFPAADRRIQVSADGGSEPVWSPDGRTLYYRRDNRMFAVPVQTSPRLDAGRPVELFQGSFVRGLTRAGFDVAADGRFVMVRTQALDPSRPSVDVRVNWFDELRRLEAGSPLRRWRPTPCTQAPGSVPTPSSRRSAQAGWARSGSPKTPGSHGGSRSRCCPRRSPPIRSGWRGSSRRRGRRRR